MFVIEPSAGRLSICLRCQYRLTLRENPIWRSPPIPNGRQGRRISRTPTLSQQPAVAQDDPFELENPDHDTGTTSLVRGLDLIRGSRRLDLYRRDLLGINSLGRPAKALILRCQIDNHVDTREKFTPQHQPLRASELLQQVEAESGVIGAQRVAEHLEEIRSIWASTLPGNRKPSAVEFHALERSIDEGFTRLQLAEYYGQDKAGDASDLSSSDLSSSFSNNLYTRSEWSPTITEFPGKAAQRLYKIKNIARQGQGSHESGDDIKPQKELNGAKELSKEPKSTLIGKILRLRWKIQPVEDVESPGQIDIWPRRASLRVLLNHHQNILEQVSRTYGVEIHASARKGLIRINADRATSGDVLKFIIYMLERILHRQVDISFASRKSRQGVQAGLSKEQIRSAQLQEQLQQLTNTIIEPDIASLKSGSNAKVTIHFLGPSLDDFRDAKRLLLQSLRPPRSNKAIAVLGASQNHRAIAPVPIDIGNGLPFVQRSREWSRWAKIIKRNQDNHAVEIKSQAETRRTQAYDEAVLISAMKRVEQHQRPLTHVPSENSPLVPRSPHWQAIQGRSNSVSIGRVIYPTDVVQQVRKEIAAQWEKRQALSPEMWQDILGPHEFLSSRNGLLLSFKNDMSKEREFILIKLSPKGKHARLDPLVDDGDSSSRNPEQAPDAPDLEIYLDIDQERQHVALKEVRAILRIKKTDLLLPHESNDLRFVSEQYAISSAVLDPNLQAFVNASNLAFWGSERLKTPPNLVLDVPRFNRKDRDDIELQGSVEYAFTALEHRTQLFASVDGFRYEYTMIEAGRSGGQREGFCIHVEDQSQASPQENPVIIEQLVDKARRWIADMSTMPDLATLRGYIRPTSISPSESCGQPSTVPAATSSAFSGRFQRPPSHFVKRLSLHPMSY